MPAQGVALGEAHVALRALEGLLSRVDPLVPEELPGLAEPLGAYGADEIPLACVDMFVPLQVARALESLAAERTDVRLALRVRDGVALQVGEVVESPWAKLAVENSARTVGGQTEIFWMVGGEDCFRRWRAGGGMRWVISREWVCRG